MSSTYRLTTYSHDSSIRFRANSQTKLHFVVHRLSSYRTIAITYKGRSVTNETILIGTIYGSNRSTVPQNSNVLPLLMGHFATFGRFESLFALTTFATRYRAEWLKKHDAMPPIVRFCDPFSIRRKAAADIPR